MVIPVALIAAALDVGTSLFEGSQASKANRDIAQMNYNAQQQQQSRQQLMAQQMLRQQQEGVTDEYGNRRYYVPGRGWVTELSPTSQTEANAAQRENVSRLTDDAYMNRILANKDFNRALSVDDIMEALLYNISHTTPASADEQRMNLVRANEQTNNNAFDQIQSMLAQQALRTGKIGTDIVSQMAAQRQQQAGSSNANAYLQGIQNANILNTNNSATQQLGALSGMASIRPGQQGGYQQQDTSSLNGAMSNLGVNSIAALGKQAPQFNYVQQPSRIGTAILGAGLNIDDWYQNYINDVEDMSESRGNPISPNPYNKIPGYKPF